MISYLESLEEVFRLGLGNSSADDKSLSPELNCPEAPAFAPHDNLDFLL